MTTSRGTAEGPAPAGDPLVLALDGVGKAVRDLAAESRAEREARDKQAVIEREEAARRDRHTRALLAVIAFLVVVIGAIVVDNRLRSGASRQILKTIEDCTAEEADGDCYERNQARTGALLGDVFVGSFDISWCVKISDSKPEAARCITAARQDRAGK